MTKLVTTYTLEKQPDDVLNSMFLRAWFELDQASRQRDVAQANVENIERALKKRRHRRKALAPSIREVFDFGPVAGQLRRKDVQGGDEIGRQVPLAPEPGADGLNGAGSFGVAVGCGLAEEIEGHGGSCEQSRNETNGIPD